VKIETNSIGLKVGTFKNVDNGETIERDFTHTNINPPSIARKELVDAGITDSTGTIDVNKYTL